MNYLLPPALVAEINATDYGPAGLIVPERIAAELDHDPGCRRPRLFLVVRLRDGAPTLRCSTCNRYLILRGWWLFNVLAAAGWSVGPDALTKVSSRVRPHPVPEVAPPAGRPTTSAYWCRDHPDQPVDHRGRGCPECR